MTTKRTCRECATAFEARGRNRFAEKDQPTQHFCSPACRRDFNNRRQTRGAQLYDLFRAVRRERDTAREMTLWTSVCRLEEKWQEEDDRDRPGRRSYVPPREALMSLVDAGRISRRLTPTEEREIGDRARERTKAHYQKEATP